MSQRQRFILTLLVLCLTVAFVFYYIFQLKQGLSEETTPSQNKKATLIETGPILVLEEAHCDFEKNESGELSDKQSSSGKFSQHLSDKVEYGYTYSKKLADFESKGRVKKINYRFKLFASNMPKDALVVCAINDAHGKTDVWLSAPIDFKQAAFIPNVWNNVNADFDVDFSNYNPQHEIKVYVWNRNKNEFYTDDVAVKFLGYSSNPTTNSNEEIVLNKNVQQNFEIDFESDSGLVNTQSISNENPRHGKRCVKLSSGSEYGAGISRKVEEVTTDTLNDVFISAWIYPKKEKVNVVLVASITTPDGKTKTWQGKGTEKFTFKINQWNLVNAWHKVGEANAQPGDVVTAYIWNKGKDDVYADDMLVVFGRYDAHAGEKSLADMRPTSEEGYKPVRNKPPYATQLFTKVKIASNANAHLNADLKSELFPDANFIVGDFLKTDYTSKTDELIQIHNKTLELFSYCEKENAFVLKHYSTNDSFDAKTNFIVSGFFSNSNKNSATELLTLNKITSEFHIYQFVNQENCNHTISELKEIISGKADLKLGLDLKVVVTDIDGDSRDELILISENDIRCMNFNAASKTFKLKSKTDLNDLNIRVVNMDELKVSVVKPETKSALFLIADKTKKLLVWDAAKKSFVSSSDAYNINVAKQGDEFYQYNNQLLRCNTNSRNEFQLMSFDDEGLVAGKNIDFTGYEKDFNPKYYEMCKLIPGNFLQTNSTSIIVIQKNCADKNFDGGICKQYDELNDLPAKVEVYGPLSPKGETKTVVGQK